VEKIDDFQIPIFFVSEQFIPATFSFLFNHNYYLLQTINYKFVLVYSSILNHRMVTQIWLFLQNLFIKLQITATAFPLAFLPVILVLCSIEKTKRLVHMQSQRRNNNKTG